MDEQGHSVNAMAQGTEQSTRRETTNALLEPKCLHTARLMPVFVINNFIGVIQDTTNNAKQESIRVVVLHAQEKTTATTRSPQWTEISSDVKSTYRHSPKAA